MSEINLTTRKFWKCRCGERNKIEIESCSQCGKEKPLLKSIGSHLWNKDEEKDKVTYEVRYSEVYQPIGHDYTPDFEVLREKYWFEYRIIDNNDIYTYQDLQFLCKKRIPFTIEGLAKEKGIAEKTLRKQLDNLQNAELLELYQLDAPGKPYHYVLRTPYFSREVFKGENGFKKKQKILEHKKPLPESFLEDNFQRLRVRVQKNYVRHLKNLSKSEKLKSRHSKLYQTIQSQFEEKKLFWFRLVKYFGENKAASLDDKIWKLAKSNFAKSESMSFDNELKHKVTGYFNELHLDKVNLHWAIKLFHHYCPNVAPRKKIVSSTGTNADNNFSDTQKAADADLLRLLLKEKASKNPSVWSKPSIKDCIRVCKEYGANLDFSTIEKIAREILPDFIVQKLTVELRN